MRTRRLLRRPRHAHIFLALAAWALMLVCPPVLRGDAAVGIHRNAGRERPLQPDRDAVRAGRPTVRLRAGRPAARHQERRAAADAVSHADRQLRRANAVCSASPSIPAFATNHFVYVYYTATTPTVHNRISRFTANGDVAVAGSEVVILELDNLSSATNHNGGALAFGADGKLYAAVGENANGANAQSLNNLLGKMLPHQQGRHDPDRQPVLRHRRPARTARSGRSGCAIPFTFAFNPAGTADVHQRCRPEHVGGDQRRHRRRQLRLADDGRSDDRSAASTARDTPTATPAAPARSPAAHSTRR